MYIKNDAGFRVNWLNEKIVHMKCQTFISWSRLLAIEVVIFKTSKPYLVCSSKFVNFDQQSTQFFG